MSAVGTNCGESRVENISVAVIEADATSRRAVTKFLNQMGLDVVAEAENLASGMSLIKGYRPDLLILELPSYADRTLMEIHKLKKSMPSLGILVVGKEASPQLILNSMRSGAQEFLTKPLDGRQLQEAVNRLSALIVRSETPRKKPGKILSVFSSKGGVGVTSIATNLAVSFAQNTEQSTVLVDLDLQMGDVGLLLDLKPEYSIIDAVSTSNLDESRLKGLLAEHSSGISLLSMPTDPVETEVISPDLLLEVFSLLKNMFDVIVVDAGHSFDSRLLEVMSLSDLILLIAGLDVPTVRNVSRCLSLFDQLGYEKDKVYMVVNREQKKSKVTIADLEEIAEMEVLMQIPGDYKSLISSIDAGIPAVMQNPKSKISKSIQVLTQELNRVLQEDRQSTPSVKIRDPEAMDEAA